MAVEYFCKDLSICCLGSANPSYGDENVGEDGSSYIDWAATLVGRDAVNADISRRRFARAGSAGYLTR